MARKLSAADISSLLTLTLADAVNVTDATNVNPIVVTAAAHGLTSGDYALVEAVGGNTNANGLHKVTVLTVNTFSIAVAGNSAYTAGGTVKKISKGLLLQLKPGDLEAIGDALARVAHVRGKDSSTDAESDLRTIFATNVEP